MTVRLEICGRAPHNRKKHQNREATNRPSRHRQAVYDKGGLYVSREGGQWTVSLISRVELMDCSLGEKLFDNQSGGMKIDYNFFLYNF